MPFPAPDYEAAAKSPTVQTTWNGFTYDSTSQVWKEACAELPSCAALQWPGYETTLIEAQIDGRAVVIQPWLGHCQQFFGRPDFPGGYGGEVAVYVRAARGDIPDSPLVSAPAKAFMRAASLLFGGSLLWPDASVQPTIEFTIINPIDHSVLVRAPQETSYWVNRWMQPASYELYKQQHHAPGSPTQYKMVFTVAGVTRAWSPTPGDFS